MEKLLNFRGIPSPYEPPEHPDIVVDTTNRSVEEVVDGVWGVLSVMRGTRIRGLMQAMLRVGVIGFGGGNALIPVMERSL